jgi:hypothetical protein
MCSGGSSRGGAGDLNKSNKTTKRFVYYFFCSSLLTPCSLPQINSAILQTPALLLAPLSTPSCTLPSTLQPRVSAAISAFTQSLADFLHFFKVSYPVFPPFPSVSHSSSRADSLPFSSRQATFLSVPHNRPPYAAMYQTAQSCMLLALRCKTSLNLNQSTNPAANNTAQPPNHH